MSFLKMLTHEHFFFPKFIWGITKERFSHDVGDNSDSPNICRRTHHFTFHHLRSLDHMCQEDANLERLEMSMNSRLCMFKNK